MLYLEKFNLEPTGRIVLGGSSEINTIVGFTYEPIPGITFDDNPVFYNGKVIKFIDHPDYEKIMEESRKMQEEMYGQKYIVNITTEKKKKKAVIHFDDGTIDFDEKKGDKKFTSKELAEEYADSINNSK